MNVELQLQEYIDAQEFVRKELIRIVKNLDDILAELEEARKELEAA